MRDISCKVRKGDGFTLLEVMIGLAILAGVIMVVVGSLNYHIHVADHNRTVVLSSILGRSMAEEMRLKGIPSTREGDFGDDFSRFTWNVHTSVDENLGGIERVELIVTGDREEVDFVFYTNGR